jgi:hypothetical protein
MMTGLPIALALAAMLATGPAPVPTLVVEAPRPAEDKPVCKYERSLSSRVVKRTCKTAAERSQEERDARNKIMLGKGAKVTEAFKTPSE